MDTDSFADIFAKAESNPHYWEEMAILEFTDAVAKRVESLNWTRVDLAAQMGVSPAFVTKLMCGKNNFTLRTMVRVAHALACELTLSLVPTTASIQGLPSESNSTLQLLTPTDLHLEDALNHFTSVSEPATSQVVVSNRISYPVQNAELALAA